MRKLLVILDAMVRDGRSWDPNTPLEQLKLQHGGYRLSLKYLSSSASATMRAISALPVGVG